MVTFFRSAWGLFPLTGKRTGLAFAFLCSIVAPLGLTTDVYATPTAAPALTVTANYTQATASWTSVAAGIAGGTVSYTLQRDGNDIFTGTNTSYIDTAVVGGSTYTYKVVAKDNSGSTTSAAVPVTVQPRTNSISGNTGDATNYLNWSKLPSATSYKLYRNGTLIYTGANLGATDTGLTNGNSYGYYVVGNNGGGDGLPSNSITLVPVAPVAVSAPSDPQNITPRDEKIVALFLAFFLGYLFLKLFRYHGNE